jgi:arabinofuranosyltransferase
VLWVALGIGLRANPIHWAWAGSIAAMIATLVATYAIARWRDERPWVALVAVGMLATNYTFLAYATSGLETMLQTALLMSGWLALERLRDERRPAKFLPVSVLFALAILTRLDSVVMVAVLGVALLLRVRPTDRRGWGALFVPGALLLAAWFAFKLAFYGALLPNTFHAKVGGLAAMSVGLTHAERFLHWYGLWPFLVVGLALAAFARGLRTHALPLALVSTWFAYVILIGGDFMEFRFFVPMMPPLFVFFACAITTDLGSRLLRPVWLAALATAILAFLSFVQGRTFRGVTEDQTLDSVSALGTFYGAVPNGDWARVGSALGKELRGTGATISTNDAGAIPFYSDVYTIDQLGLTDAWVARNGVRPGPRYRRPGHQRFATVQYLQQRNVTFVLGSPRIVRRGFLKSPDAAFLIEFWLEKALGPAVVSAARIVLVEIPVDEKDAIVGWYLTPNAAVTAKIRAEHWPYLDVRAR